MIAYLQRKKEKKKEIERLREAKRKNILRDDICFLKSIEPRFRNVYEKEDRDPAYINTKIGLIEVGQIRIGIMALESELRQV